MKSCGSLVSTLVLEIIHFVFAGSGIYLELCKLGQALGQSRFLGGPPRDTDSHFRAIEREYDDLGRMCRVMDICVLLKYRVHLAGRTFHLVAAVVMISPSLSGGWADGEQTAERGKRASLAGTV
jgi:hypothetical protein